MDFSNFVQKMNGIIGNNKKISAFTRTLFESALPADERSLLINISNSTFKAYYYGQNSITYLAKKIYAFVNPSLFEKFLSYQNKNTNLCSAFSNVIPNITPDNSCKLIADFFYSLLLDSVRPVSLPISGGGTQSPLLTLKDVAKYLNVKPKTVRKWIKQKGLPAVKISGMYRFNMPDVCAWAKNQHNQLFISGSFNAPDTSSQS